MADTSTFLKLCLRRLHAVHGVALDIPCGNARHGAMLQAAGYKVIFADIDKSHLCEIPAAVPHASARVCMDALSEFPFAADSFDLVVMIHAPFYRMLLNTLSCVKPNGYLIYETVGAQGGNWRQLPDASQTSNDLMGSFDVITYQENPVTRVPSVVTVKALFRKRHPG
jgi:SAM-dependent methyltransferase